MLLKCSHIDSSVLDTFFPVKVVFRYVNITVITGIDCYRVIRKFINIMFRIDETYVVEALIIAVVIYFYVYVIRSFITTMNSGVTYASAARHNLGIFTLMSVAPNNTVYDFRRPCHQACIVIGIFMF